ncbi:sulfurtransferase, partial [Segnochrobactrum spirostomi]
MTIPPLPPIVSTEVLARELARTDRRTDLVVLDATIGKRIGEDGAAVRHETRAQFEDSGHIPGALYADLLHDFSDPSAPFEFTRPPAEAFETAARALGIGSASRIVVYDSADGIWAARLWWLFRAFGHDAVQVLDGGLTKWRAEGRPLAFGPASALPGDTVFEAHPRAGFFVDLDDVRAIVEGRAAGRLVCVLRPPVFDGRERVYARSGHIPGSLSRPYRDLIEPETNALRSLAALRAALGDLSAEPERLILYCGGGITAAGTALALTLLGARDIAIYDGSLSEWSADPSLPMVTTKP